MPGKTNINGEYSKISAVRTKKSNWKTILKGLSKADGVWITVFNNDIILTFLDYPHPIPVMAGWEYSTDGSTWITVSADGEINADGTFTGSVKVASALTLNDYSNGGEQGLRVDGTPLSVARDRSTSFVNGNKGYVCGGVGSGYFSTLDVYDLSGNHTTGTDLSAARYRLTSFVNGNKGYVCGGRDSSSSGFATVDVYDLSGNHTIGTPLSAARHDLTSFVNGNKGYVCGGYGSAVVDIFDASGNRTTGTPLSVARKALTSFVNGNKGYVCGGGDNSYNTNYYSTVDIFDASGNRTTGTPLSVARYELTSFVNNSKGYVCGGYGSDFSADVDVFDASGNRTTGTPLSAKKQWSTSFVNGNKGYVCGGAGGYSSYSKAVDIYYDEHIANIPITEGSTYTLNGTSGTATESGVLTFGEKVSGTINYKSGGIQV